MKTLIFRIVTVMLLSGSVSGIAFGQAFSNVGFAGANFLKIPVEPVGVAMGNSLVASAQGVLGLYWNPAAIASTKGTEVIFSRVNWIADTHVSYLGAVQNLGPGTIGISVTALTMDDMEVTTETQPNGTGAFFTSGSYAIGVSYGLQIIDRFSFGGTVKYIYEYIWETHGSAYAFDFGSLYKTDFHNMRIGMRLGNFGGDVIFTGSPIDKKPDVIAQSGISYSYDPRLERVSKEYPLPQIFNVGISLDPLVLDGHRVTVTAAVNDPNDNTTQLEFGAEYVWQETLSLRGGYKTGFDEQNISVGLGVNAAIAGSITQLDLAYAPFGRLGNTGVLSVRVGF